MAQGLLALQQWWQALYNNMCVSLLGRAAEGWRMLTVHRMHVAVAPGRLHPASRWQLQQLCSESTVWSLFAHACVA
jgi:hypothetical protein